MNQKSLPLLSRDRDLVFGLNDDDTAIAFDSVEVAALVASSAKSLEACRLAIPEIRCLYNQLAQAARFKDERNVDQLHPDHAVAKALAALNGAIAIAEGRAS